MGVRVVGPFNSGAAVGADGSATANATSTIRVSGKVLAVHVKYNDSPPAATTDVTVATAGTSPAAPAQTILSKADSATDAWYYPRVQVCGTTGTALTYDGTRTVNEPIPVDDLIKVTIAQANAADNVDVWLMVD